MRYTGPLLPEYDPELKLSCEEAEADLDLNSSTVNSNPILEELGSHHQVVAIIYSDTCDDSTGFNRYGKK